MYVTIVTETFPPEVNGVAMTLHHLASGLVAEGHRVDVIRPRQKRSNGRLDSFGEMEVSGFPLPGYEGLRFGLPCKRKLRKHWSRNPPDVLYVATEGPLGISAIGAARKLGIPVTSGFHTNFNQYMKHYAPGIGRLMARYLRWVHNRTWCTYTPSPTTKAELEELGIQNVKVLGRGVDTQLYHPDKRSPSLRQEWNVRDQGVAPLFVSRLAAEKNMGLTAQAFQLIEKHVPGSRGIFVGDGPGKAKLEKEYPSFHYAGMRQGEALATHYASGDLFVFPSITETFGNVVTEALASGLIVIAYDYAAPHLYIEDGVNGFLAPYDDEAAYLATVERALEARDQWPSLRAKARATAEGITWSAIIKQFVQTLEEASSHR